MVDVKEEAAEEIATSQPGVSTVGLPNPQRKRQKTQANSSFVDVPDHLAEVKQENLAETFVAMPDKLYVLKLSPEEIRDVLHMVFHDSGPQHGTACVMLPWQGKVDPGTDVCMVETAQQGSVAAIAKLDGIRVISTFGDLRASKLFTSASALQRQAWRNRVLKGKKSIFEWSFSNVLVPGDKLRVPRSGSKSYWLEGAKLQRQPTSEFPEMNLRSTAGYFVRKLSATDRESLKATLKAMDGKTISYGSTCSGTDVCVCVMESTFAELSELFGVF